MTVNKKACENLGLNGGSANLRDLAPGFEGGLVGNCEDLSFNKKQNNNNNKANSSTRNVADFSTPPEIQ